MNFRFVPIDTLPRLAWCARLQRHEETAAVYHGPWVETSADWFVEGAWDGPFDQGKIDEAPTLMGSGGHATRDGLVFAGPTHTDERLYTLLTEEALLVSNSPAFVMVQGDDEPDLGHANYYFDLLRLPRRGTRARNLSIPTRRGRRIGLHHCCNLVVKSDLSIRQQAKIALPPPVSYEQYYQLLQHEVVLLVANANDPARRQRFRPVVMLSRGYDAPAIAVLARQAGCTTALVFTGRDADHPRPDDDGSGIAERLGMQAIPFGTNDYMALPGCPEAEFFLTPPATRIPIAIMESALTGSMLFTGNHGDLVWSVARDSPLPHQQFPSAAVGAATYLEFRLRTGIIAAPAAVIGASDRSAIFRISISDAMKPWSVPGDYNRPIARRIVEQAGIPRGEFAQHKSATSHRWVYTADDLSPSSREDFRAFCARHSLPRPRRHALGDRVANALGYLQLKVQAVLFRLPARFLAPLTPFTWLPFRDRRSLLWGAPMLYGFHWGFATIRHRYVLANAEDASSKASTYPEEANCELPLRPD